MSFCRVYDGKNGSEITRKVNRYLIERRLKPLLTLNYKFIALDFQELFGSETKLKAEASHICSCEYLCSCEYSISLPR